MNIFAFIIPLPFAILGIILRLGKGSFLISGYNTSSKEEKEKYDEVALCKFMGNLMFFISGIQLIIVVAWVLNFAYFMDIIIISSILIFFGTIGIVIYLNTGDRFKKQ
ncbi:MAG: DUF3784 domain-containing protein [Clostridiaceae bacterium]|nr:DUF3784 domain-containing protein [Clostridiaceae bacterium]